MHQQAADPRETITEAVQSPLQPRLRERCVAPNRVAHRRYQLRDEESGPSSSTKRKSILKASIVGDFAKRSRARLTWKPDVEEICTQAPAIPALGDGAW